MVGKEPGKKTRGGLLDLVDAQKNKEIDFCFLE